MRRPSILIPLAALLATLPLIVHGCSCGHDFDFHLQSWLDAAEQMRHGTVYPRWTFSAAYNAGEPRFLFYPPLSWMLGALLTLVFPIAAAPGVFTFVALCGAGFAMYRLARYFVRENAALVAAVLYLANPYMLFNAFERTAYAELLAATWIPLLLLGVLRRRPTVAGIGVPLALLWLTNAPAAVMGTYALALLACVRLAIAWREKNGSPLRLAVTSVAGFALGLALAGFYLIPAAYERRYVRIAMAIIPTMRLEDNFLFGHTADAAHNVVLHGASVLGASLLGVALVVGAVLAARRDEAGRALRFTLLGIALLIAFLLVPVSMPVWAHLPEMAFLQFPWRLLTILSAVLGLMVALLLGGSAGLMDLGRGGRNTEILPLRRAQGQDEEFMGGWVVGVGVVGPVVLGLLCFQLYGQPCIGSDLPVGVARTLETHHGVGPTDEYTPVRADNDFLRADDPAYWLADDPRAFAPHTVPNPAATDPNYNSDELPEDTLSAQAPRHFGFHADRPGFLILNLRDYPSWVVTETGPNGEAVGRPAYVGRDDGLIAIAVPHPGDGIVDIRWRYGVEQVIGFGVTGCGLVVLGFAFGWRRVRAGFNRGKAYLSG